MRPYKRYQPKQDYRHHAIEVRPFMTAPKALGGYELSGTKLLAYARIWGSSEGDNQWYTDGLNALSYWTGATIDRVKHIVAELVKDGIVVREEHGRRTYYRAPRAAEDDKVLAYVYLWFLLPLPEGGLGLKGTELLVYARLYEATERWSAHCWYGNMSTLAGDMGMSRASVYAALKSLEECEYIGKRDYGDTKTVTVKRGRREVELDVQPICYYARLDMVADVRRDHGSTPRHHEPRLPVEPVRQPLDKATRQYDPPTLEQVEEFARLNHLSIDPARWYTTQANKYWRHGGQSGRQVPTADWRELIMEEDMRLLRQDKPELYQLLQNYKRIGWGLEQVYRQAVAMYGPLDAEGGSENGTA